MPQPLTVYPKKYANGFCFAVLCCGYTLTDFPISIRLTSLALWQSNDCPSASKATLMNMDKYFMWIHYERLHNHNKAKHNKTVCIFLGIYCISPVPLLSDYHQLANPWASYQIRKIAGCACAGNAGNVFPRRRFQRKPLVSDPDMHHGTCVTHVPWCMSGSLTCGNGENVPGIPGACAPGILRIWQEAHYVEYTIKGLFIYKYAPWQYRDSYHKDKMDPRLYYLYKGNP